jgi:SM-20-related protein
MARGISIRDQFAAAAQIDSLLECAQVRQVRGDFTPARIGSQAGAQRREEIRGDFTCWWREPFYPAEHSLLEQFEALRLELNRDAYLGLLELELHYARYPPGAGYARHVDQPRGATQRKVSLVLYLNRDWSPLDGGMLRLHETADRSVDIEPIAGRLVCFLTAEREHEVLPAQRERLSISGWFRGRE